MTLINENNENGAEDNLSMTESGLPGVLFRLLDTETDKQLIKDVHDTLTSMLQMLAGDNLTQWLSLCRSVLTVTTGTTHLNYLAFDVILEWQRREEKRNEIHDFLRPW